MVMTSSSSAAVCGLSVLFASVAGCGLISSDIASIGFDLPERSYTFATEKKGVNLPDTLLPIPALTEKDRADLEAAASLGVDWIALSFVQRPEDVAIVEHRFSPG